MQARSELANLKRCHTHIQSLVLAAGETRQMDSGAAELNV